MPSWCFAAVILVIQYNLGMGPDGTSVSFFRDEISGPASDHGAFRVLVDEIVFNQL